MATKKRDNGEDLLQRAITNWVRAALPDVTYWHVRNEFSANAIQGKQMKDKGVLPGVHDCHFIWAGGNYATIELKNPNKPNAEYSPKQKEFADKMQACGFRHAVCQSGDEIEATIRLWGLKPLFRFPASLASTKRLMTQQVVMDALWRR